MGKVLIEYSDENEFSDIIDRSVEKALKKYLNPITPKIFKEGGLDFACEVLGEKAGINKKSAVYKLTFDGRIPHHKRGRKLWFYRDELEAWIEDGMPHIGQINAANRLANSNR